MEKGAAGYPQGHTKPGISRDLASRLPYRTSSSEGGGWKSTHKGNSLTAYPTTRCGRMKAATADMGTEATTQGASVSSDRSAQRGRRSGRSGDVFDCH